MPQSNCAVWLIAGVALVGCGNNERASQGAPAADGVAAASVGVAVQAPSAQSPMARSSLLAPTASLAQLQAASLNEWLRCSEGFTTSGDVARDVLRLGMICGPSTGMQPSGPKFAGTLNGQAPTNVRIDLARECVRIVAAAGGSVEDLEIELLSNSGQSMALVNLDRPWAVLPADKPLCTPYDATHTVRLVTHGGEGPFALRVLRYWPTGQAPGGTTLHTTP